VKLKNLEYQIHSVPNLHFHFPFFDLLDNSIDLPWLEDIADDYRVSLEFCCEIENLIKLAFPYIGTIIRFISFLKSLQDDNTLIRRDELSELRNTVLEAKSGKKFGILWSYIKKYCTHSIIVERKRYLQNLHLQKKYGTISL
jgi:hypothetical protein